MTLFTCFVHYSAQRIVGRSRSRWEDGTARIVVMALDEIDAESRAGAWFAHQTELAEWPVIFGRGTRDALSVRLRGEHPITAHDDGAISVISIE